MQTALIVIMNELWEANSLQIILYQLLNETDKTALERQCDVMGRICLWSNIISSSNPCYAIP